MSIRKSHKTPSRKTLNIIKTSSIGVAATMKMNMRELVIFLSSILESSTEYSIVAEDLDGTILAWNEGAFRMYGYQPEEIIGKSAFLLHDPEDIVNGRAYAILNEVYEKQKWTGELKRIRKNKERFIALVTITLRKDKNNIPTGFTMISHDITRQKLLEKKLIKSNQELEQFAFIASHDLKAPLRAIESLVSWIAEDNIDKISEESKKHMELLKKRTRHMANLIDGILQYSRVGSEEMELTTIDTKLLLQEVIENLNPPDSFHIEISQSLPVFCNAKILLFQIFSNLISNSIKHHHLKEGHIQVDAQKMGKFYRFSVADDGPGIEPQYHEKIFQMFQTLESIDSTGIGLSLVKKIVEHYGGKVTVESQKDKGSIFSFTWPIVIQEKK